MQAPGSPAALIDLDPRSEDFANRLGALLTDRGLIDELALRRAQRAQQQSRERFDVVLTRLGLVPEAMLAQVLADALQLPAAGTRDFPDHPLFATQIQVAFLKLNHLIPIADEPDRVVVAVADPFNSEAVASLSFLLGRKVERRLAPPADIDRAIERLYGKRSAVPNTQDAAKSGPTVEAGNEDDVRRLEDMASEAPIIKLVHDLVARAVEASASDIHIEPREDSVRVRFRIDGLLHTIETLPLSVRAALASRVKIMAQMNIAERRLPQDGRIKISVRGREIDLRVSTMPTINGESVVLRILDRSTIALDFAALGFSGGMLLSFQRLLAEPNGIILVTGPTGSGKTTTLYTALATLNDAERKLFTVEDPIEYQMPGVNQIQVAPKIGLTFASALRSILRQDPDIIMVGEIRDLETAEIAIRASLTGHLVLSTVHTNSAAATVTRLLDMGVEDYLLASSLKGVLAQRLVRRLCPECATPEEVSAAFIERLRGLGLDAGLKTAAAAHGIKRAAGCRACRQTGFSGRTAIYELLPMTSGVRDAVLASGTERAIEAAGASDGMSTMLQSGIAKVIAGETTFEEVLRVTRVGDGTL